MKKGECSKCINHSKSKFCSKRSSINSVNFALRPLIFKAPFSKNHSPLYADKALNGLTHSFKDGKARCYTPNIFITFGKFYNISIPFRNFCNISISFGKFCNISISFGKFCNIFQPLGKFYNISISFGRICNVFEPSGKL